MEKILSNGTMYRIIFQRNYVKTQGVFLKLFVPVNFDCKNLYLIWSESIVVNIPNIHVHVHVYQK